MHVRFICNKDPMQKKKGVSGSKERNFNKKKQKLNKLKNAEPKDTMHWRRMKNEQRKIIKIFPNEAHTDGQQIDTKFTSDHITQPIETEIHILTILK